MFERIARYIPLRLETKQERTIAVIGLIAGLIWLGLNVLEWYGLTVLG